MCDKAWEKGEEIGRAHEDIDNKWNFLRSQWIRPQGVGQSVSQWRHSRSPSHLLGNPQLIIHYFLTTRYHQSCECTNLDWISFKTHDGVAPHTRRVWVAHKSLSCERVLSKLCGLATKQWLTVTQPTEYEEILQPPKVRGSIYFTGKRLTRRTFEERGAINDEQLCCLFNKFCGISPTFFTPSNFNQESLVFHPLLPPRLIVYVTAISPPPLSVLLLAVAAVVSHFHFAASGHNCLWARFSALAWMGGCVNSTLIRWTCLG